MSLQGKQIIIGIIEAIIIIISQFLLFSRRQKSAN